MKNIVFLLSAVLLGSMALAGPVGPKKARQVAESFLQTTQLEDLSSVAGVSNVYVFQRTDTPGFVMVAGDERANPILGFSYDQPFMKSSVSPEAHYWMSHFSNQMLHSTQREVDAEVQRQWDLLLDGSTLPSAKSDSVGPLLTSTWNQTPKYNIFCPGEGGDGTNNCPVGCLALAYAQIMRYYQFPSMGYGSNSYNYESIYDDWNYGTLYARFDSVKYKYDKMPDRIQGSTSVTEVRATAWLCYQIGIAIDMHYTRGGSGGFMITEFTQECTTDPVNPDMVTEFRIPRHFGYKYRDAAVRRQYSDSAWVAELLDDLDNGRPIHYAGWYYNDEGTAIESGHAFILDGYVYRDGQLYYHVNWGWGGSANGWFLLDAMDPGSMTFDEIQGAILGLEPDHARLNMVDDLAVERHGRHFSCKVANNGTEAYNGLFGVRLTTANDTLWLLSPAERTIAAGDTVELGGSLSPSDIPMGDYKATAMYGYNDRNMLGIAEFAHSNHCDVYVDLDIEDAELNGFTLSVSEGRVLVRNLQSSAPVELIDVMGRRVTSVENPGVETLLEVPSAGVYVVRQGRMSRKVVVL